MGSLDPLGRRVPDDAKLNAPLTGNDMPVQKWLRRYSLTGKSPRKEPMLRKAVAKGNNVGKQQ